VFTTQVLLLPSLSFTRIRWNAKRTAKTGISRIGKRIPSLYSLLDDFEINLGLVPSIAGGVDDGRPSAPQDNQPAIAESGAAVVRMLGELNRSWQGSKLERNELRFGTPTASALISAKGENNLSLAVGQEKGTKLKVSLLDNRSEFQWTNTAGKDVSMEFDRSVLVGIVLNTGQSPIFVLEQEAHNRLGKQIPYFSTTFGAVRFAGMLELETKLVSAARFIQWGESQAEGFGRVWDIQAFWRLVSCIALNPVLSEKSLAAQRRELMPFMKEFDVYGRLLGNDVSIVRFVVEATFRSEGLLESEKIRRISDFVELRLKRSEPSVNVGEFRDVRQSVGHDFSNRDLTFTNKAIKILVLLRNLGFLDDAFNPVRHEPFTVKSVYERIVQGAKDAGVYSITPRGDLVLQLAGAGVLVGLVKDRWLRLIVPLKATGKYLRVDIGAVDLLVSEGTLVAGAGISYSSSERLEGVGMLSGLIISPLVLSLVAEDSLFVYLEKYFRDRPSVLNVVNAFQPPQRQSALVRFPLRAT